MSPGSELSLRKKPRKPGSEWSLSKKRRRLASGSNMKRVDVPRWNPNVVQPRSERGQTPSAALQQNRPRLEQKYSDGRNQRPDDGPLLSRQDVRRKRKRPVGNLKQEKSAVTKGGSSI